MRNYLFFLYSSLLCILLILSTTPYGLAAGHGEQGRTTEHAEHESAHQAQPHHMEMADIQGEGVVKRITLGTSKIAIKHDRLSDEMPAMTMEFSVADPKLLQGLKKGDLVKFRINPDRVITQIAVK